MLAQPPNEGDGEEEAEVEGAGDDVDGLCRERRSRGLWRGQGKEGGKAGGNVADNQPGEFHRKAEEQVVAGEAKGYATVFLARSAK